MANQKSMFKNEVDPLNVFLIASIGIVLVFFLVYYFSGLGRGELGSSPGEASVGAGTEEVQVGLSATLVPQNSDEEIEQLFVEEDPFEEVCEKVSTGGGEPVIYGNTVCF